MDELFNIYSSCSFDKILKESKISSILSVSSEIISESSSDIPVTFPTIFNFLKILFDLNPPSTNTSCNLVSVKLQLTKVQSINFTFNKSALEKLQSKNSHFVNIHP